MASEPALTDYHTIADIRAALHAGQISGGMTVEVSWAHPELQDEGAIKRFVDYADAYGVRVHRLRGLAPVAVYLRRRS